MAYEFDPLQGLIPRIDPVGQVMRRVMPQGFRRRPEDDGVDLTDEQREGLISRAGKQVGNWVGTVGNLLDLPGSMARDTIAAIGTGDWSKHNPLDQLISPFSPDNRITGQQLNSDVFGLTSNEDTWTNFGLGLATDIVTDPTTWIGFGPVTKAGNVLRKTGLLDEVGRIGKVGKRVNQMDTKFGTVYDTLLDTEKATVAEAAQKSGTSVAELMNKPLRAGMSAFGMEFAPNVVTRNIARAKDALGTGIANSLPGRTIRGLFDYSTQGEFDPVMQQVASLATKAGARGQARQRTLLAGLQEPITEIHKAFSDAFGQPLMADPAFIDKVDEVIRATGELQGKRGRSWTDAADLAVSEIMGSPLPGGTKAIEDVSSKIQSMNTMVAEKIREYGGNLEMLDSETVQHMARFGIGSGKEASEFSKHGFGKSRKLSVSADFMKKRAEGVRDLPTFVVDRMGDDPLLRVDDKHTYQDVITHVQNKYQPYLKVNPVHGTVTEHAQQVADFFNEFKSPNVYDARPLGKVYGNAFENLVSYTDKGQKVLANIRASHNLFADNLRMDGGGVPLQEAFAQIGLKAAKEIVDPATGAKVKLADGSEAMATFLRDHGQQYVNARVDASVVAKAKSFLEKTTQPQWERTIFQTLDKITRMFTRNLTSPFPAFAVRNLGGGQTNNLLSGEVTMAKLPAYVRSVAWAWKVMNGKAKLSAADEQMVKELFTHDVGQWGFTDDTVSNLAKHSVLPEPVFSKAAHAAAMADVDAMYRDPKRSASMVASNVAALPQGAADVVGSVIGNPVLTKPAKMVSKIHEGWATAGERVNQKIEFMNRVSMYKYLRDEGWSAPAAKARMEELQVAYHELSPFEKKYLRRKLIPFYTYTRKYGETVVRQLMEQPGGPLSRTIQASNRLKRSDDATTPEYVQNTLSIGGEKLDDGSRRYLTGFGLGHEDPLQFATALSGDLRGAGLELISRMNPMIKAPIEFATGVSAFQRGSQGGRRLEDIDPLGGRIWQNISDLASGERTYKAPPLISDKFDQLLANLPVSRHLTTLRQLTDRRKLESPWALGFNLGSGVKVVDVSPAAQDAMLQDRLNEVKREMGGRTFGISYFPKEVQAKMSPEEYLNMLQIKALEKEMKLRKDERKLQKK